jgi:hypothetical protein
MFSAIRHGRVWQHANRTISELEEDFREIEDQAEAERLLRSARRYLHPWRSLAQSAASRRPA